ncbi:MAG: hypothetical protein LKF00_06165 [Olsenella sp.]|nr:hypothetical protein [Olsenella sp.]
MGSGLLAAGLVAAGLAAVAFAVDAADLVAGFAVVRFLAAGFEVDFALELVLFSGGHVHSPRR